MKNLMKILSFSLLLSSLSPISTFAAGFAEYQTRAQELVEKFKMTNGLMLSTGEILDSREILTRFKSAHDFVFEVIAAPLTDDQKAQLIVEVSEASGKMFVDLTEPYIDVAMPDFSTNARDPFFNRAWDKLSNSVVFFLQGIGRDVVSIARGRTLPFFGQDAKRTALVGKIGKDLKKQFKQAAAKIGTEEGKQGVAAALDLLQRTRTSEVIRYGAYNGAMAFTYLSLGIWQFFDPITELPFERTTFSPIFAGSAFLFTLSTFAITRYNNSGMTYNMIMSNLKGKILKIQNQFNFDCNQVFKGKGLGTPKVID